ncbi:acetyltransferase [Streptomyces sp. SPB78]|nr:acetyltransferase [Streptomyces sp. SPB78]
MRIAGWTHAGRSPPNRTTRRPLPTCGARTTRRSRTAGTGCARGATRTGTKLARALAASDHSPLAPPHGLLLMGRYGGEAAGCVGLRASRLGPDALELTRMYVRPAFRGLGGGGLLLRAAEAAARERGARRLDLDTRHDLVEARGLYARHGWRETGPLWEDVYAERWFRKELGAAEEPGAEEVPGAAA